MKKVFLKSISLLLILTAIQSIIFAQISTFEGSVKIADGMISPPEEGTIRFNESTKDFEGFDGVSWKSLTLSNLVTFVTNETELINASQINNNHIVIANDITLSDQIVLEYPTLSDKGNSSK